MTTKPASTLVVSGLDTDIQQLIQCQHLTPDAINQLLSQLTQAVDANSYHQILTAQALIRTRTHNPT